MTHLDKQLLIDAESVVAATLDGIKWIENPANFERLGEAANSLGKELRRGAVEGQHLVEATKRPMAVAVFGASQVGKSHLISVLARANQELYAVFDGVSEPVSYISKINIDKGTESTGLVTRFTLRKAPAPTGYPVCLRWLTHIDIIKILANAYFFDGKPNIFPERDEIEAHIDRFRDLSGAKIENGLRIEDIWDLQEYFKQYLSASALTAKLGPFWTAGAKLFQFMSIEKLADFLSLLWGGHATISKLYCDLVGGLQKLNFPKEAFVPLSAIDATDTSIISIVTVDGLNDLASGSQQMIEVRTQAGSAATLPRSTVAALTAELWITIKDKPWDFFDYTDLLDFPGYRSRGLKAADFDDDSTGGPTGIGKYLETNPDKTLKTLLLRGKVEYLFQRYVAEQEITSMLLCSKPSNMDVDQLPQVVTQWIAATHGAKPSDRIDKEVLLFFVFTMFDTHFEQKQSDASFGLHVRFEGRMKASLLDPFGSTADTWVNSWSPQSSFNNCYLMRNPNIFNHQVFNISGEAETAVREDQVDFIERLKDAFLSVPSVGQHFRDPGKAFDEMMTLNDGGARYIAENLAPICDPRIKSRQIRFRLEQLKKRLHERLAPHYLTTDATQRLEQRLTVADWVMEELYRCDEYTRFGSLLRGFMLRSDEIADQLHHASLHRSVTSSASTPAPASLARPVPAQVDGRPRPGADRPRPGRPAASVAPAINAKPQASRERLMAEAAVSALVDRFFDRADESHFGLFTGISNEALREIANELSAAVKRTKVVDLLENQIAKIAFVDRRDQFIDKATVAAENILNRFVADLGMSLLAQGQRPVVEREDGARPVFLSRPTTFDASGIQKQPDPFATRYVDDWIHAFYQVVQDNALSEDGVDIDPQLNAQLGQILDSLAS